MSDSRLAVYNQRHHNCVHVGELHGLADAMRHELLECIAALEEERDELRLMVQNWSESENEPDDELCDAYSFYRERYAKRGAS